MLKKTDVPEKGKIVEVLNEIDDKEYEGPNEILKEIGEVE